MVHCKRARRRPREPDGVPAVAARASVHGMRTRSSSVAREMAPTQREAVFGGSTPAVAARASVHGMRTRSSSVAREMAPTQREAVLGGSTPAVAARSSVHGMRTRSSSVAREMAPTQREAVFGGSTPAAATATSSSAQKSACSCSFKGLRRSPSPPQLHRSSTTTAPHLPLPAAPANMADAAGVTRLLPDLPDEITIWEILVRLPPKPLLRCRAVSPAWRHATTTCDFLVSHHARQPALPLLYSSNIRTDGGRYLDIVHFDHRAGVAAADRFQSVARLKTGYASRLHLCASCDGLLVFSSNLGVICICNPATQEYASLDQLLDFRPVQMYPHPTISGEYRLLLYREWGQDKGSIYVFTIGSGQPPRKIGCPDPTALQDCDQLLFQGSIYWYIGNGILVFDTTDESFRKIRIPFSYGYAQLFEMGDMLAILSVSLEDVDIWVLQDYQAEVWDFKCRVELPVAETRCQCPFHQEKVMVVSVDNELVLLLNCDDWLFQVDAEGKLIATFHSRGNKSSHYLLKQTLVRHQFFPTLEGYVVKASEDYVV